MRIPQSGPIDRAADGPPTACVVASVPCRKFKFRMHKYADQGGGMSLMYKSRIEKNWIENRYISVAADSHGLPVQVIEI